MTIGSCWKRKLFSKNTLTKLYYWSRLCLRDSIAAFHLIESFRETLTEEGNATDPQYIKALHRHG